MRNGDHWTLYLAHCVLFISTNAISRNPKLLLISFDGFRWDLLNQTMTPNIYKWAKENTWFVNGSKSQYITFTAPNHMGIVTGLYEESHGIVSNYFFDTATNKLFDYFNSTQKTGVVNESLQVEWFKGEPIWISNERGGNNRLSSTYFWPMGEANFPSTPSQGHYHKQWTTYGNLSSWMSDCDEVIDEFVRMDSPVNFLAFYIAEPDMHKNGFYNGELKKKMKELDHLFRYLLDKLASNGLEKKINIILTADHGHSEIIDQKHVMCIRDFLPEGDYFVGDHMIYPRNEKQAQDIYEKLTEAVKTHNFQVKIHLKEKTPHRWHYEKTSRIGAVVIEPEVRLFHYLASTQHRDYGAKGVFRFNSSTHGMDPDRPEMRAILVMAGPNISTNNQILKIPENIDLYPFMCHLLNVTPAPNNGSLPTLQLALKAVDQVVDRRMTQNVVTDTFGFMVFFIPPFIIVLLYFVYGCRHTIMKDDPGWALKNNGYHPLDATGGEEGTTHGEEIHMLSLSHGDNSSVESF